MSDELSPLMQKVVEASNRDRPGMIARLIRQRCHGSSNLPEIRSWNKAQITEAVIKAARDRSALSRRTLEDLHNKHPKLYPLPSTIDSLLGQYGWHNVLIETGLRSAKIEAVSSHIRVLGKPPEHDVVYFLDLLRRFGLRTKFLYLEARRRYPEVVPSYKQLLRVTGGMKTLHYLERLESCEDQLRALVGLMHDLGGRWPRKRLCRERVINRLFLERKFGGRVELEELCRELLPYYRDTVKTEIKTEKAEDAK
jgi:hypothetical protein